MYHHYIESFNPWTWYVYDLDFLWFFLLVFCSFSIQTLHILLDLFLSISSFGANLSGIYF